MSWQLFQSSMGVLTGLQHVSREQFSDILSKSYHECILRHFDALTAGGVVMGAEAKLKPFRNGILNICEANLGTHDDINFLEQITPLIYTYWAGLTIIGPTGLVVITGTGNYIAPKCPQNLNFNIILNNFMLPAFRCHIATLIGIYTSTVILTPVPLVLPWSGGFLQTIG